MKKKFTLALVLAIFSASAIFAGHDIHITFKQLPDRAQQLIGKYFPDCKISLAKMEIELLTKSYDVIFTNGSKLEFASNGQWTKIKCRDGEVPSELVPEQILQYVNLNYPQARIVEIERKRTYYEIELSNKLDIKFDKKFRVLEIDS